MSNFIVGLTGGIGSGKTTIANQFALHGITLVDADIVAREIVEPGSECLNAIIDKFGPQIILADGNLDRAQLRQQIFSEPAHKQWLDALMHPAIRQQMLQQLEQAQSVYCILVAPLLFENNLQRFTDVTLVVDVSTQTQELRTTQRDGVDSQQVKNIINAQIDREQRRQKADFIIDNDLDKTQALKQITPLHQKFIDLAKKKT
jgi:dephospho-CoA kinase